MSTTFDDDRLRAAMAAYLDAARRLDEQAAYPGADSAGARVTLDLAEAKSLASLRLRRRLEDLGWTAPARPQDGVLETGAQATAQA